MVREAGGRRLTIRTILLAVLVAAGAFTPLALAFDAPPVTGAPATTLCAAPEKVPGIGYVCPRGEHELEIVLPDGSSGGFTHGPDPVPLAMDGSGEFTHTRPPVCADPVLEPFRAIVIYARAEDDDDNYARDAPRVRDLVERSNALVAASAARGGSTADLRVECDEDGRVKVHEAVLSTPKAEADFSTIGMDLLKLGFVDPRTKLWVYYDDTEACGCGGTGSRYSDSRADVLNDNNGNRELPQVAVTFGYMSVRIMLHELGHTLGAVSDGSPHGTGAAHCWDGRDIMCYNDGGPRGRLYSTRHCSGMPWDCGNDDYFHVDPAAGTFLAKYWNLASPVNRFVSGCLDASALTAPGPVASTFDVPDACRGHPVAAWVVDAATERGLLHPMELCWKDATGAVIECTANALETFPLYPVAPFKEVRTRVPDVAGVSAELRYTAGEPAKAVLRIA